MALVHRLPLVAAPLRALAETALLVLGLALLTPAFGSLAIGRQSVLLLVGPLAALYCALRLARPAGTWQRQARVEILSALATWALLAGGCLFALRVVLHDATFQLWPPAATRIAAIVLSIGGVAYVVFRAAVRAWLVWDQLRRRRLLWALTHAHLTVVAVIVLLAAAVALSFAAAREPAAWVDIPPDNPLAPLAGRLIVNVLPVLAAVVLGSLGVLAAVLPVAALVSLLIARRTTRRVEQLAAAAEALRAGDYGSRVLRSGDDELSLLQGAFNAMAADLQRTVDELAAERDRVAGLLEARRQLVAAVSHELRTPVATIRGYLEADLTHWADQAPAALYGDLMIIAREAERLQRLIDDLFTLARADAGGLPLARVPVDAAGLAREVAATMAPLAWRSARVTVLAEAPPGLPPALADEGRLVQILVNLAHNAVSHTPPGGIVALAVSATSDAAFIVVRDTGEGIAPDELPQIWEPFYRGAGAPRQAAGGAGLGLALVRELAEAMGGSVAVESTPGLGSCFTVQLPLASGAPGPPPAPTISPENSHV